jgi:putative intracellular protease/amidase
LIAIVRYPGLTALDAIGPYEVLRLLPDAEVLRRRGARTGRRRQWVLFLGVTHSYAETPRPDIVLVPGSGPRTATMTADKQLTGWLRRVHETLLRVTDDTLPGICRHGASRDRGKKRATKGVR